MKWWRARRTRTKIVLVVLALFLVIGALSGGTPEGRQGLREGSDAARATGPTATSTVVPSVAPAAATGAPTPARTTAPTTAPPTPRPTPSPVALRGRGQTATDPVQLPAPTSIAAFTHDGQSNFVVQTFRGSRRDLLINEIGPYNGRRPLTGTEPIQLNIEADGNWTATIVAIECCANSGEFTGRGDNVSNQFNPPGPLPSRWEFTHDGQSNFVVQSHCRGGTQLIQNRIGSFSGSAIVVFDAGPCFWEVQADGNWTIRPR